MCLYVYTKRLNHFEFSIRPPSASFECMLSRSTYLKTVRRFMGLSEDTLIVSGIVVTFPTRSLDVTLRVSDSPISSLSNSLFSKSSIPIIIYIHAFEIR